MAQRIGPQRIGVPARKPPPKPPKNAPPGVRGPVGVKSKAPIDVFFHAVHGGKPPGVHGPVGVKAPKAPKLPPVGPRGAQGALPGVKSPAMPKPQKHGPLPTGTVANNKHLVNLNKGNRPGQSLLGIAKSTANTIVGGNPILSLERAVAENPLNPRKAVSQQSNQVLGPDITSAVTGGKFSPLGLGLGLAALYPGGGEVGRGIEGLAVGSKLLKEGEGLAKAAKGAKSAFREGANPADRVIHLKGETVTGPASRSITLRSLQRGLDKASQRSIDRLGVENRDIGLARSSRIVKANVGNLKKTDEFYTAATQRAPLEALTHSRLSPPKQLALRMVAHETPPDIWIKNNLRIIADGASAKTVKALKRENALVAEARKYVRVVDAAHAGDRFPTRLGKGEQTVVLDGRAPRDVQHAWAELLHAHAQTESMGKQLGKLGDEQAAARLSATGRFHRGARWDKTEGKLVGAEDFKGGRIYMPSTRGAKKLGVGQAHRVVGDVIPYSVRAGSEFRHPYRGVLGLLGEESSNITRYVGEVGLARQRLYQGTQKLEHLQSIARPGSEIEGENLKNWQPIRLKANTSNATKAKLDEILGKISTGGKLTQAEHQSINHALGDQYENIVLDANKLGDLNPEEIGFVPKAQLGTSGQHDPFTRFDRIWGSITDPLKKAIVYTKVGHVGPRTASNLFFNLGQQGVHLVPTAAKTFILSKRDPEIMRWVDQLMGHGSYQALGEGVHFSDLSTKALVTPVRVIADLMPRRFSFIYEAEKAAGKRFYNMQDALDYLQTLKNAPPGSAEARTLRNITQRARVLAGEYQRMSNFEKRKVSKFLFLYAWHRTAAVTAGKFALEHPLTAAAVGYGTYKLAHDVNGNAPPWQTFGVPVGGGKISNLSTSLPWSTPVEDARTLYDTAKGAAQSKPPALGTGLTGDLNPSFALLDALLTGHDIETGNPLKKGPGGIPASLWGTMKQMPPVAAASGKHSLEERLGKYLLGNPFPQTASVPAGLSNLPGSITPAQHKEILKRLAAAEKELKRAQPQIQARLKAAQRHKR